MPENIHDIPGDHIYNVAIPVHSPAASTGLVAVWYAPFKCKIRKLKHTPSIAITGNDTDHRNLNVYLKDGVTEIAALDYATGVNAVAATPKDLTLSGTDAQLALAEGDALLVESELVGVGVDLGLGCFTFLIRGN